MEDAEIIRNASSGLALCGICIDGVKENMQRWPLKQILQCPRDCHLQGPIDPVFHQRLEFHSEEESLQFTTTARKSGLSAALNLVPPITKMSIEHSSSHSTSNACSIEGADHCILEVYYAPTKSFRLEQRHMLLSEEALRDLPGVNSLERAQEFLRQYHSHVSTGVYHLGAIYFRWITSATRAQKSSSAGQSSTGVRSGIGLSVVVPGIPLHGIANLGFHREQLAAGTEEALETQAALSCTTQVLGGPVGAITDLTEFFKETAATPSSWAIINSAHMPDKLVPIWNLMLQSGVESLQKPAELLRETWQSAVAGLVHKDGDLLALHQASIRSTIMPTDASKVQDFSKLRIWIEKPGTLHEELPKLWMSLPYEKRPELLTDPDMTPILRMVVARDDMKAEREMLRGFIQYSPHSTKILDKAGISLASLSPGVREFPSFVPEFRITPEEVPHKLLQLLEDIEPTLVGDSANIKSSSHLLDSINRLLKVLCIYNQPQIAAVLQRHNFKSTDELNMIRLKAMIEDLRLVIKKTQASSSMAATNQHQPDCMAIGSINQVVENKQLIQLVQEGYSSDTEQIVCQFTYTDDFCTHKPFPQQHKHRNLIDRISHGLAPFENYKLQAVKEDDFWDAGDVADTAGASHTSQEEDPHVIEEAEATKSFIHIYQNSDFRAQISLLRLLLDQRWGVPLVFSSSSPRNPVAGKVPCFHTMQALNCVRTKVGAQSSACSLVQATNLPRVVFLSNHHNPEHEHMAQQVTKYRFLPFPYDSDDQTLYMQLGMSFLPSKDSQPYLVVVASGSNITEEQCIEFLNETADMLIMQVEHIDLIKSNNYIEVNPLLTCKSVLRWAIDSSAVSGKNTATKGIWGSSSHVAKEIARFLASKWNQVKLSQEGRKNLRSICTTYFEPKSLIDQLEGLEETLGQTDFGNLREKLVLQCNFLLEAAAMFESLKLRHDRGQKQIKLRQCNTLKAERKDNASRVAEIPIIQFFLKVLQNREATFRSMCILKLQNSMQEQTQKALKDLNENVEKAFREFQMSRTPVARDNYNYWKDKYAEKVVGLEHLWREVCHLFLSDPQSYSNLPKLAARHLLDGFPLEILDGDAKLFNDVWVKAVLNETEELIKQKLHSVPRILVLSVLGTQSSGKTTLLNVMFGTHLPTKAGRCTRGVQIQLVKSGWQEYDYILLMDTEGIRCPEHYGSEQYLSHDNRMATFAILPSDACIMVVANEDDSSLKEVLPLVLLAFKGSAAAERNGGRLRSKLFFVYRSVDIYEQGELRNNQQKLLEYLVEAERHIIKPADYTSMISHSEKDGDTATALFDLHVDDEEARSDVKFLGSHKKESMPPEDIPDSRYGQKVIQLQNYMHKRVTQDPNWTPFDLREFGSYMNLVWSCIWDADFELSFQNAVEYQSYMDLQNTLQSPRSLVSRKYVEEFENLEKVLASPEEDSNLSWLQFNQVKATINEQSKCVKEILEGSRWLKWKAEELRKWKDFLKQQETWFNMQLQDHKLGVVLFENLVNECDQKMQQEIMALCELPDHDPRKQIPFDIMFLNFLDNANKLHKPSADRVPEQVNSVYNRHKDIVDSFEVGETQEGDPTAGKYLAEFKDKVLATFLINARQYSDDLVEGAINSTNEFILIHAYMYHEHRQQRAHAHACVKEFVTQQLYEIQRKWDEEHNPAEKLKKQQNRFQNLYIKHMSGFNNANLLVEELNSVFKDTLKITIQQSFVKQSCASLEKEPWLSNWKIMRGLLDAFLLKLLQDRKFDHVLDFVSDGALYHRLMVEELIKRSLEGKLKHSLEGFRGKVKEAVSYAGFCAEKTSKRDSTGVTATFRDKLAEMFCKDMPACSNICPALYRISIKAFKACEDQLDFTNIVIPGLHRTVDDIFDDLVKEWLDEKTGMRYMADMVKKGLASYDNYTFRPRCEEPCPRCGVTCLLPAYHYMCHETLHQPQGLKGTVWEHNMQLSEKTCSEHYRDDESFILDEQQPQLGEFDKKYSRMQSYHSFKSGRLECYSTESHAPAKTHPYRQFDAAYPYWKKPADNDGEKHSLSCKVRQCIFFHSQSKLVERYPTAKQNNSCAHFAHPIGELRYMVEEELPGDLRIFIKECPL